jgi:hypothetical protein
LAENWDELTAETMEAAWATHWVDRMAARLVGWSVCLKADTWVQLWAVAKDVQMVAPRVANWVFPRVARMAYKRAAL